MNIAGRMLVAVAVVAVACVTVVACSGCTPAEPPAPETPPSAPLADAAHSSKAEPSPSTDKLPPGHPPMAAAPATNPATGKDGLPTGHPPISAPGADEAVIVPVEAATQFVGISLTPPAGWQAIDPGQGMMSAVAAFTLPRAEGDSDDASARLTYFPGMKDIPLQQNLERWYGQVVRPDGKLTKDVTKIETIEAGGATITLVDMSGSINGKKGQRMIAAHIDHPQGPHFLKVAGPEATVAKWRDSVIEYLNSAKVAK